MQNFPPSQPSTFIGRSTELAVVGEFLQRPTGGLLTLAGPGGIGKTCLAQQALSLPLEGNPAICFVRLDAILSVEQMLSAIAEGVHFSFYNPGDQKQQLLAYLREKKLVLVLDGFEHLNAGAGLIVEILEAAPQIKILVTSRQRLNLPGEQSMLLEGLAFPPAEAAAALDHYEAVQLFQQAARRLEPAFTLRPADHASMARICQLVDGLPLAIEMAAAWVRALSCQEIAQEITSDLDFLTAPFQDTPERHQSLRVIFDTSWKLLLPPERATCRRLSIFRGSFTLEAAQAVAGASAGQLATFADKSLLRRDGPGRYAFHNTLRQYAVDRLSQFPDEEAATQKQYCAYFAACVQGNETRLRGAQQKETLDEISAMLADVRGAWEMAVRRRDENYLARAAEGVFLFYTIRALTLEGYRTFGQAAAAFREGTAGSAALAGRLLLRQAAFAHDLADYATATQLIQKGLNCLENAPLEDELAFAWLLLGRIHWVAGDPAKADAFYKDALDLYQRSGNMWGCAKTLDSMGASSWSRGDFAVARQHFQQAVELCRQRGDLAGMATGLDHLGVVARDVGQLDEARHCFEESYATFGRLEARLSQAYAANHLGGVLAMAGKLAEAEPYFEQCIALGKEIGERRVVAYTLGDWGTLLAQDEQQSARVQALLEESLATFEAIGDQFGIAILQTDLGSFWTERGEFAIARGYYQQALRIALRDNNTRLMAGVGLGWVDWLAQQGEVGAAMEWLTCLLAAKEGQPSRFAQEMMDLLAKRLSAEELEQARQRGLGLNLAQIGESVFGTT